MKSKMVWHWVLVGASFGYFVFHPLVMIVGHIMLEPRHPGHVWQVDENLCKGGLP